MFNLISLDGYFAGPNGELDWHNVDDEFNDFALEQTGQMSLLIFGRLTYEVMMQYWPTPVALKNDPIIAAARNNTPKIVYSRTLEKADWNNTELKNEIDSEEIKTLKQQPGGKIAIFGSGTIVQQLTNLG